MPTPSWPNASIGPDGFSFPSSFQDSFHKPVQIDEDDESGNTDDRYSEENRLAGVRKESALTVSIPQSSGYDSYDDPKMHTMDIEQDNYVQEQKQFLDTTDGHDETKIRNNRNGFKWYKSKRVIALIIVIFCVLLFLVIFGAVSLAKHLDSDDDKKSVEIVTKTHQVEKVTTPKPQINTDISPSKDPNKPVVAIKMVVDENYAQNGKGHVVLWRAPQGKHIQQGITYNNGTFRVPVDGYYTYTSTLKFDTRDDNLEPGREIHFHHCVKLKNTQKSSCSTNGIPVNAIRSDIVYDSWVPMRAGQEVFVTLSKVGFISDSSDSNTFTMSLMTESKETR